MEKLPQPKITLYEQHKCGQTITITLTLAELDMTVKNDTTELIARAFTHDFTQPWEPPDPVKQLVEAKGSIESVSFDGIGYERNMIFCLLCKEDYLFPGRHG